MMEIAAYIDVPDPHIASNRTQQAAAVETDIKAEIVPLIRIRSGRSEPPDPFVAVQYDGYGFWIESNDFDSKRVFTFLMLVLMLSETGEGGKLPVLTIPAG